MTSESAFEFFLILVVLSPWLWDRLQDPLVHGVYTLHYRLEADRAALWLMRALEALDVQYQGGPLTGHRGLHVLGSLRAFIHEARGETARAVALARELAAHAREDGCWRCANCAVNVFINAGLYREALGFDEPLAPSTPEHVLEEERLLVHFNLVEADYNRGGWDVALGRLEALRDRVRSHPMMWNFFPIQLAWILAHTGRGAEALAALDGVDVQRIPRAYQSEFHYTRAAALLAVSRHDDARVAAQRGLAAARRAASHRNGLFLQGRIALAAGQREAAARFFEAGAAHRYQGQGGDALLAWGDGLARWGRTDEARAVWRLVRERDPQSDAAREAASRETAEPVREQRVG